MAQNLVQEMSEGLTKYTANLVMDHRTYMEELPSHAKRNGYRPTATLTSTDKQRMQRDKVHYMQVPWYNLTQGEEMNVFTATTEGARNWKRLATKARIFMRQADLAFLTTAHKMYMQRRDDYLAHALMEALPPGSQVTVETSSRRSSARRAPDNVLIWSIEYRYGLPMTRQRFSPYTAIWDPMCCRS